MNPYRMAPPPRWWGPKLKPWMVRMLRPIRRRKQLREHRLLRIDVQNAERVRELIDSGTGVLITPNHSTHADAFAMYAVADAVGAPFHFMSTWHVFDSQNIFGQWALQWHGCFSIDREGTDMQAFRTAVGLLAENRHPLVIFPEGEVYHLNDRVTPFREGPSVIALSAAKRGKRPIACVPCGMKFEYLDDPTPKLLEIMNELERQIFWRAKADVPLPERIALFADAILTLKEKEWLGEAGAGSLSQRTNALAHHVLSKLETEFDVNAAERSIPERVKELRSRLLARLTELPEGDADARRTINDRLDDVFFVVQLFSYPGNYVSERPSIERLAETLDKFEEDVLGKYSATIRGDRKATIRLGEPISVEPSKNRRAAAAELTHKLERGVQSLLDSLNAE